MGRDRSDSQLSWNPLSGPGRGTTGHRSSRPATQPLARPAGGSPPSPRSGVEAPLAGAATILRHRASTVAHWLVAGGARARVSALLAIVVAAGLAITELPHAASAAPNLPVPYSTLAGAAAELTSPGASPPGANDWSCRPTAAHPEPVVLVHGLGANMTENWQTISPLLANNGYCVFALTYGTDSGAGLGSQVGGLQPMEQSARDLGAFVDRVLAATGARKVDLVGHSEGATMPYYYLKALGGTAKVARYVGLAPVYHGTTLFGLSTLLSAAAASVPGGAALVSQYCGSCQEFLPGSSFLAALDATAPAVSGVSFTDVTTRFDEVVVPYTSGFLNGANVTNIVVQDQCPLDLVDHVALAADPVAAQDVLNALDPAHAVAPACTAVLPFIG